MDGALEESWAEEARPRASRALPAERMVAPSLADDSALGSGAEQGKLALRRTAHTENSCDAAALLPAKRVGFDRPTDKNEVSVTHGRIETACMSIRAQIVAVEVPKYLSIHNSEDA